MKQRVVKPKSQTDKRIDALMNKGGGGSSTDTEIILYAADWSTGNAPYSQVVQFAGMTSSTKPIYDVVLIGTTVAQQISQLEQYGYISRLDAADGEITFVCLETLPTINIKVNVKVVK